MFPVTGHCLCSAIVVSSDCPISCHKTCITTPSPSNRTSTRSTCWSLALHPTTCLLLCPHLPHVTPVQPILSAVRGAKIHKNVWPSKRVHTSQLKGLKNVFFLLFLFLTGGWICLPTSNFCQIDWVIFCMDLLIRSSQILGGSRSWCDIVVM